MFDLFLLWIAEPKDDENVPDTSAFLFSIDEFQMTYTVCVYKFHSAIHVNY